MFYLGGKADAIFADTGYEYDLIYRRIELIEKWCKDFHRSDFKIHKVKNEQYGSLQDYILDQKFYPNFGARYCTRMFKIEPIDHFLEQYKDEGAELMIGLNVTEIEQRTGNHGNKSFINYSYPLADNGLNREMCSTILRQVKLYPDFPPYMQRGGCIGCYFKSRKEYTAMAMLNPEEFAIVEKLENDIQDKRKEFFSIIERTTMKQIRPDALSSLFGADEIYPVINNVTKCGVFCNR